MISHKSSNEVWTNSYINTALFFQGIEFDEAAEEEERKRNMLR